MEALVVVMNNYNNSIAMLCNFVIYDFYLKKCF